MADLGATTYSVVVWTTGDVITEAKLDNMVANDQAYDSHAAQGLLLDNNKAYCGKNAAGTAKNIVKIDASDNMQIGGEAALGHIVLTPGTSKLVKIAAAHQTEAPANSYQNNVIIQTGYTTKAGGATPGATQTQAVTFPVAFTALLSIVVVAEAVASDKENAHIANNSPTTTAFTITWSHGDGTNLTADTTFKARWIAIGTLA